MEFKIATDIGGTFTDLIGFSKDENGKPYLIFAKESTTPTNFEEGIFRVLEKTKIPLDEVNSFIHGTTIVINALTERKGVRTALITTNGFRDVLEIARCNRPDLFNFNFKKQPPFVERYLRYEVEERVNYKGEVLQSLDNEELDNVIDKLVTEKVEAVAISFINSYKNPVHEKLVENLIKQKLPDISVISSHSITREWREYERTSTAVLSAYVSPVITKYLDGLNEKLNKNALRGKLSIMQSNGGLTTIMGAKNNPISMVESGPVGGILGGAELGKEIGHRNLIVLDIGGTTAKCSLIKDGKVSITNKYYIEKSKTQAGYPIMSPVVDIVEIGNGGGSKTWIDQGGKLHVGPKSAGAYPGPAAYGLGGDSLTTTDANIAAGYIHPDFFLGGDKKPDFDSIDDAIKSLRERLNVTKEQVIRGVLKVANNNMINALKLISINKGHDPRDFALMVIGGGGPLHGVFLAHELQIKTVIVPNYASVFSALGMLKSDFAKDYVKTSAQVIDENLSFLFSEFEEIRRQAKEDFVSEGFDKNEIEFKYYADLRYSGQEHYVKIPINIDDPDLDRIVEHFNKEHNRLYSFQLDASIEWVNYHLNAIVKVEKPALPTIENYSNQLSPFDVRKVDFADFGIHSTPFYEKDCLMPNNKLNGPAIIVEKTTSTVIPPSYSFHMDSYGNIIIERN